MASVFHNVNKFSGMKPRQDSRALRRRLAIVRASNEEAQLRGSSSIRMPVAEDSGKNWFIKPQIFAELPDTSLFFCGLSMS